MYLAILSGVLLAFAYPVFNLEFLAFLAFVPLFIAIKNSGPRRAFFISYLTGLVFFAITIYWLIHVTLIGLILLVLYLALYFGIFGFLFKLVTGEPANRRTISVPLIWVLLEYLRSMLITGFGWVFLGYSQYLNLPFIQIADITGVWGVSFLVMLVNVAIYNLLARKYPCHPEGMKCPKDLKVLRFAQNDILLPFVLLLVSLTYGYYRLYLQPIASDLQPIRISLIQGNIPQYQKWDENFRASILERYETLTKKAAKNKPDLIIWPETSVPGVIGEEPELLARVLSLAKAVNTPILAGAVTSKELGVYYNSALLISADGEIIRQYNKLHLVPFGEYVPLEKYFPFLRGLIGVPIGDFTAGREYTIFELKTCHPERSEGSKDSSAFGVRMTGQSTVRFSTLICFEDIIPGLSRRFVKEGAQFLVNITNDAWFMESSAPYQHAAASVFRAIENRAPVVRAANTGFSCFIDPRGRIYDKVSDGKKDIFVVGYSTKEIEVRK